MKMPTLPMRGLVLGSLLLAAGPGRAEPHVCGLLQPADVKAILGEAVAGKPNAGACAWKGAGSARKLVAARMKATGPSADMAYAGARGNMGKDAESKVTDLAGVGDKAFAVQVSYGVAVYLMKGGRLLQLQYMSNTPGTAKDVEAMRAVARKAATAF